MIDGMILGALGAAFGATMVMLALRVRGAAAGRKAARAGYFDRCLPLLSDVRKGETPHGFARVAAVYRGHPVDLQALPDMLSYRKLPALWLLLSIPAPMPVSATINIMRRPSGSEVFSRFGSLPVQIETPSAFPPHTAIRTDDPDGLPERGLIEDQAPLFADERVKELVISPKGLRIVWLADEAERTRYLLFRDAEVGRTPIDRAVVETLLDRLADLAERLASAK